MTDDVDLPAPIRTFVDATNAGDTARFVAAFAADAELDDWGRRFHGRDGIAGWNETDNIGKRARFTVEGGRPGSKDGEYLLDVTVGGDGFNGRSTLTFTVADGLISRLVLA
jgi:phenylacetic acid degradation operon negative regulatory protein